MGTFFDKKQKTDMRAIFLLVLFLGGYALSGAFGLSSLLLFLGLVLPAAVLAFLFPRAGFLASVVLTVFFERFYTLQPILVDSGTYKLYPLDVILAVSFFSVFLLWFAERKRSEAAHLSSTGKMLVLFFVFTTVVFLASIAGFSDTNIATAFSTWKNYVFYGMLFFFVPLVLRSREDVSLLSKVFFSGIAITTVFLVIGIARGGGLWTEYTPLSTPGTRFLAFPHAFYFSLALLVLVFSAGTWIDDVRLRRRNFVFMSVLVAGILGSLMRHLWLGIGAVLAFGFVFSFRNYRKRLVRIASFFIGSGVLLALAAFSLTELFPMSDMARNTRYVSEVVSSRLSSIGNSYDESFAWREQVWESALARFWEHPVTGIGFGVRVPVELGEYRSYVEVRDMHNSWLALLVQTGAAGVVLMLGAVGTILVRLTRRCGDAFLDTARSALFGLIVFQCLVLFSQPYLETNLLGMFFWITLGVSEAVIRIGGKPKKTGTV